MTEIKASSEASHSPATSILWTVTAMIKTNDNYGLLGVFSSRDEADQAVRSYIITKLEGSSYEFDNYNDCYITSGDSCGDWFAIEQVEINKTLLL
jgi:hypothetical protein